MATIRIREWTKEQLEEIRERESHSSHDSVIKSLLKDHQLAQFLETRPLVDDDDQSTATGRFEDLTVFEEVTRAESGILFLWCPSCGREMVHLTVDNPLGISAYEMECQQCLTRLDQHAIVAIEIGYPLEERIVDETLQADLKRCVIEYWDRTLRELPLHIDEETDPHQLVGQFTQYRTEFGWEWDPAVPVIDLEVGGRYRDETTGDVFEVIERVSENPNGLDDYRVRWADEESGTELMDHNALLPLVVGRRLFLKDENK